MKKVTTERIAWYRQSVRVIAVLISFAIYTGVLFSLPQVRDAPFNIDRSSIASAFSNAVYGAPFGTLYSGVLEHFLRDVEAPLQTVFDETNPGRVPLGYSMKTIHDGNGSGYIIVATIALRVFGFYSSSLLQVMLCFMGFSAFALLMRFGNYVAEIVILYFSTLTIMLFTTLVWNPENFLQISVGGSRYFTLVSILPAFHLTFEIIDGCGRRWRNDLLLGAQTVILVLSVLVRSSAAPTIGIIGSLWFLLILRRWHEPRQTQSLVRQGAIMSLAGLGYAGAVALLLPIDYVSEWRFAKTFWELLVVGLGANPMWPFNGLRDAFDCTQYIPEGLIAGMPDRNGHCIWWDYAIKHHMSLQEAVDGVYGGRYETAMREAFFKIGRAHPGEVLMTFFYYKPQMIISSIFSSIQLNFGIYPWYAIALLIAAFANIASNFLFLARLPTLKRTLIAKAALLLAVSTIPSYLIAWAFPWTTVDLLFYCLFCTGLLLGVLMAAGSQAFARLLQSTNFKNAARVRVVSSPTVPEHYRTSISYRSAGIERGRGDS